MSLIFIIIAIIFFYLLYKRISAIYHALFRPAEEKRQKTYTPRQEQPKQQTKQESGNRIIHDDEGEYVDFEEIKDQK